MDEFRPAVRRFNRAVTQRIGVLNDSFLSRGRSLGHSRVLWEIGEEGAELRELRSRLDLDSGYLSRLLRSLESDGLVTVAPDPVDRRVRRLTLTAEGLAERGILDRLSDEQADQMLDPLSPHHRAELTAAMDVVERLLDASAVTIAIADPADPGVETAIAAYFDELASRFDTGFDPGTTLPTSHAQFRLPAGLLLLATLRGDPVGCVGLKLHPDGTGEIKRLWVAPAVRGIGLAARLLAGVEREAIERGMTRLHLDTNRALFEAISLYRRLGFHEVPAFNDEPYAHHWFEKEIA